MAANGTSEAPPKALSGSGGLSGCGRKRGDGMGASGTRRERGAGDCRNTDTSATLKMAPLRRGSDMRAQGAAPAGLPVGFLRAASALSVRLEFSRQVGKGV